MATMETQLKEENEALRLELLTLREQLASATNKSVVESHTASPFPDFPKREEVPLTKSEVERYGRQLIMSEIGAKGTPGNGFSLLSFLNLTEFVLFLGFLHSLTKSFAFF